MDNNSDDNSLLITQRPGPFPIPGDIILLCDLKDSPTWDDNHFIF